MHGITFKKPSKKDRVQKGKNLYLISQGYVINKFLNIRKKRPPTVPAEHARNRNKQFREKEDK